MDFSFTGEQPSLAVKARTIAEADMVRRWAPRVDIEAPTRRC